jgi:hypothetical protein
MSGFLGRLLARNRDGMNPVRPRLPGRFEPVRMDNDRHQPDPDDVRAPDAPSAAIRSAPTRREPATTGQPVEPDRSHRGRLNLPQPADSTPPPAVPISAAQTVEPAPTPDVQPRAQPDRERAEHRSAREPKPVKVQPSESPEPTHDAPRMSARHEPMRSDVRDETLPRAVRPLEPGAPDGSSVRAVSQPRPRPASPKAATRRERADEPSQVVRIHIGRIEVRAVHEPPPAPAPTPPPQPRRLTLEEYARQRQRGER